VEGPPGMIQERSLNYTSRFKTGLLIFIIVLFHVVGLVGFGFQNTTKLFMQVVPYHLLLMLIVLLMSIRQMNGKFILFFILIFLLGFLAEWTGIHTGYLFGDYVYGDTLGLQLFEIPVMIGVNWFLLVYATGVVMQRSRLKSVFLRVMLGAGILVLLDVLIEPVAIRYDYWYWADDYIPLKNYVCWFGVGALMLFIFEKFRFEKQSTVAPVLLLTQFVFFIALHWI
jgi:putative membrane protein